MNTPYRRIILILLLAQTLELAYSLTDYEQIPEHVDFIIVGAGASGSVLARRLTDDDSLSVLLLEAGGYPPSISIPYLGMGPLGGEYDWQYLTEPQTDACLALPDQRLPFPRGRGLGGSTIINGMVFTRGNRRDYDIWSELGNEGWAYEDLLPLFKKMENYNQSLPKSKDAAFRGKNGPMSVSRAPYQTPLADAFLEAGKEMGYSTVDINAEKQTGFSKVDCNLKYGERHSTYKAYLEPVLNRPNLYVVTDALVLKVLFDKNQRAKGVVYEKAGTLREVAATKEVLLSAGATNSPAILMHSGIGPRDVLDKFEIPLLADRKGVGQHLMDHVAILGMTFTLEKSVALNKQRDLTNENLVMWEKYRQGPLTVPMNEGIAFVNTRFADKDEDFPDMELIMASGPTIKFVEEELYNSVLGAPDGRDVITVYPILLRPKSEGFLTINSSNPRDASLFNPRYLSKEEDVEVLLEGIKLTLQLMETSAFRQLGAKFHGRVLPHCQQHSLGSDSYWRCIIRHLSIGLFHQSGTCKMGPSSDQEAVVDSRLRVYGVKNLRVVDASITPTILTSHTMAPSMVIAEKAAIMILEDWGYGKVNHQETIHEEL